MFGPAFLVLSALSAPVVLPETSRGVPTTYPASAARTAQSAAVIADLTVDPEGTVTACEVDEVIGDVNLANRTCRQMLGGKAVPARGPDGQPVHGVVRTILRVLIGGNQMAAVRTAQVRPDFMLTVNRMPPGYAADNVYALTLFVAADGQVQQCEPGEPGAAEETLQPYFEAACSEARALKSEIVTDEDGVAVPFATRMTVGFALQ